MSRARFLRKRFARVGPVMGAISADSLKDGSLTQQFRDPAKKCARFAPAVGESDQHNSVGVHETDVSDHSEPLVR